MSIYTKKKEIIIEEYPLKVLKLGNSIHNHFEIMIIPSEKIQLLDKNDLVIYKYEFEEDGIKEIKRFLEMIK